MKRINKKEEGVLSPIQRTHNLKKLSYQEIEGLLKTIQEVTGAGCVVLFLGDDKVPCEAEISGEFCGGHDCAIGTTGFKNVEYLKGIVEQLFGEVVEMTDERFDQINID